ncbi:tripartite motif-containing protein 2-like [Ptychodera flava]|uniref:tripartite motif-containing protein 2-like n=1 Tax=Ptychodera flava TaxID=63121 RepID=UPI00396A138E
MAGFGIFDLSKEFEITPESMNYTRLCRLLIDGGTKTLREVFNCLVSPSNLAAMLSKQRRNLKGLLKQKIINQKQLDILYPNPQTSVTSDNFDITLLMVLLRNQPLCNLTRPSTGWGTLPAASDFSKEADIVRIKMYRNKLCHCQSTSVSDTEFESTWTEISAALIRLGAKQDDVDNLKTDSIDCAVKEYKLQLEEWAARDSELRDEVSELKKQVDQVVQSLKESTPEKEFYCLSHDKELVKFYCVNCDVPICTTCTHFKHHSNEHAYRDLVDAAYEFRQLMVPVLESLNECHGEISMNIKKAKFVSNSLKRQLVEQKRAIFKHASLLIGSETVADQRDNLIRELEELYKNMTIDINEELERLTRNSDQLEAILESLKNILQHHNDTQLMWNCYEIKNTVEKAMEIPTYFTKAHDTLAVFAPLFVGGKLGVLLKPALPSTTYMNVANMADTMRLGEQLFVEIQAENFYGEEIVEVNDLEIKLRNGDGEECLIDRLLDLESENYVKEFQYVPRTQGRHELSIKLRGYHIRNSPKIFQVIPSWEMKKIPCRQDMALEKLKIPCSMKINEDGNILVCDYDKNRVLIVDMDGQVVNQITMIGHLFLPADVAILGGFYFVSNKNYQYPVIVCDKTGKLIGFFGQNRLKQACGIAINADAGIVYVSDADHHAIFLFKCNDGEFIRRFGGRGAAPGEFILPYYLTINSQGHLIVSDFGNNRIQVFTAEGEFLFHFGRRGSGNGEFSSIREAKVDADDNIYVCDSYNKRIQKFDKNGKFMYSIITAEDQVNMPVNIELVNCKANEILIFDWADLNVIKFYKMVTSI